MPDPSSTSPALETLLEILDLETLEENLFRGRSPSDGWQRVFGGQVLGQALVAASRTVGSERIAHSLHGYFLLAGDPAVPLIYEVERTRDGGSFSTRRVKVIQHGKVIFTMSVSFHRSEESFEHATQMPSVPPPDALPSAQELIARFADRLPENMRSYLTRQRPIELKPVDVRRYLSREPAEPQQAIWMRSAGKLPDDLALHQCVLAYASDYTLLDTALIAHGKVVFDPEIQLASLDHALWLHRRFRADYWLLYVQDSPNGHAGRGFCRGSFFDQDGRLIASVAQEGLIRRRNTAFVVK